LKGVNPIIASCGVNSVEGLTDLRVENTWKRLGKEPKKVRNFNNLLE